MPIQTFGNSSEYLNYPVVNPTLDLNFALTKTLDPRITFTRASISAINAFIANAARLSTAYRQDDIAFAANGGSVGTDISALLPTVDRLELGQFASAAHLNGTLSRLTYWPKRLSNDQLRLLTQ